MTRDGRTAIMQLHGDVVAVNAHRVWDDMRAVARRADVDAIVLDFSDTRRFDSSGIAMVSLLWRQLHHEGRALQLVELAEHHEAALALAPPPPSQSARQVRRGIFEGVGERMLALWASTRALGTLIAATTRSLFAVATGRERLPAGAFTTQLAVMGVGAIVIVGLLSFLLGTTMAFQGAVQLQRLGAGVFVADMIGVSLVREISPLMTAIILTGRSGASIGAELGTMRVRNEIDALSAMGIDPVRFLLVPRIAALTVAVPALALISIFIGMLGGMTVAIVTLDMSPFTFWHRMIDRLTLLDFGHGMLKSLVFAWIIAFTAAHLGMRTRGDASSVGIATTRTVVLCVLFIILVDAAFATTSTVWRY